MLDAVDLYRCPCVRRLQIPPSHQQRYFAGIMDARPDIVLGDLRLAAAMSSSDGTNETSDAARRRRKRSNSLLAVGFLVFGAAAGALYYALRPVTHGLRSDRALRVYCQNLAVIAARRTHTIRVATIIYIL